MVGIRGFFRDVRVFLDRVFRGIPAETLVGKSMARPADHIGDVDLDSDVDKVSPDINRSVSFGL